MLSVSHHAPCFWENNLSKNHESREIGTSTSTIPMQSEEHSRESLPKGREEHYDK